MSIVAAKPITGPSSNGPCNGSDSFRRVQILHTEESIEALVHLFGSIADEEGWAHNGALHAHTGRSVYFALSRCEAAGNSINEFIGGLQLVNADTDGSLPSHQVWPELDKVNPSAVAHIAMLAIRKDVRGRHGGLFWLLTAAMWNHCVRAGIRELWLEATPRTMRCYELLGWPLKAIGPRRTHWGEDCYPCSLRIADVASGIAERAVRSPRYRRILADMVKES